jgi:hypothetical protein
MLEANLDGTSTEYFPVEPSADRLLALLATCSRRIGATWSSGRAFRAAVFGRGSPPRLSLLDGT